jgi:hypothetical protein
MIKSFPNDWPSECPSSNSRPASGEVFRIVRSEFVSKEDFQTHHELGKRKNADACLRRGLSVFKTQADAEHQIIALPFLGKFVARGILEPRHGETALTSGKQPTHTTWWPYCNIDRHEPFRVIDRGENVDS